VRILFTGASSFTGFWFARELARAGHEVTAVYRTAPDAYAGVRRARVEALRDACRPLFGSCFGDDAFLETIRSGAPWDLLCHHAAQVGDYRSEGFDVAGALRANTFRLDLVLDALGEGGCRRVLLTGSVFESGEGAGSSPRRAFSPYALSKRFTADCFEYHAHARGLSLGKFVIPNPFGPFEEERFTAYLARSWLAGEVPLVRTPAYVRDNVHVSLLALCYRRFAESHGAAPGLARCAPSGYVGSQEEFVRRFARELEPRLGLPCPAEFATQTEFPEPRVRINTDTVDPAKLGFRESEAWDALALHYRERYGAEAKRR
jgi:UDP-glucose 4-epimerase